MCSNDRTKRPGSSAANGAPFSLDTLPAKLRAQLMPFQREGVLFGIRKNGCCLIADEMGLGKTLQALSVAYHYRAEWPVLIVVPSSLRYTWVEEVEKWFPEITPHEINLVETGADISEISSALITVVTYGLLRHPSSTLVREALLNQNFKIVIADESHYIKNRKSACTKYLVPLLQRAPHKILLTGTPALNCPEELYPQLEAICPGAFGNWSQFAKRYCDAQFKFFGRQRRWITNGASNLEELQSRLADSILIRRLKRDVLTQLPPKQRQKISFKLKDSELKKELDSVLEELEQTLERDRKTLRQVLGSGGMEGVPREEGGGGQGGSMEVLSLLTRLSSCTCKAKLGPVKEYMRLLCENKELKFIVFAHHIVMMDNICEQLLESRVKFVRIDGSTLPRDRPRLVAQFQTDSETRVAVLSIKAAGVGLTLTAASVVVFAELNWTPGTLDQCEDRAHRIGQQGTVHVHYLVASGTLDDWVWAALTRKTTVVSLTLNGVKQVLRMGGGSTQQTDCLDNAEPYLPSDNLHADLAAILQPRPTGQKTVLDFFGSGSKTTKSHSESLSSKMDCTEVINSTNDSASLDVETDACVSVAQYRMSVTSQEAILINSDNEGDMTVTEKKHRLASLFSKKSQKTTKLKDVSKKKSNRSIDRDETKYLDAAVKDTDMSDDTSGLSRLDEFRFTKKSQGVDEHSDISTDGVQPKLENEKMRKQSALAMVRSIRSSATAPCKSSTPLKTSKVLNLSKSTRKRRGNFDIASDDDNLVDDETVNKWNCPVCTFLNHSMIGACEICSTPKVWSCVDQDPERIRCSPSDYRVINPVDKKRKEDRELSFLASGTLLPCLNSTWANGVRSLVEESSAKSSSFLSHDEDRCEAKDMSNIECRGSSGESDADISQYDSRPGSPLGTGNISSNTNGTLMPSLKRAAISKSCVETDSILEIDFHSNVSAKQLNESHDENSFLPRPFDGSDPKSDLEQRSGVADDFEMHLDGSRLDVDLEAELAFASSILNSVDDAVLDSRWSCAKCGVMNFDDCSECDGCFAPRTQIKRADAVNCSKDPSCLGATRAKHALNAKVSEVCNRLSTATSVKASDQSVHVESEMSMKSSCLEDTDGDLIDIDSLPVYTSFKYCCSLNTARIYLYDQAGQSLGVNFAPLDLELDNYSELPALLLHPQHLQVLKRFLRAWNRFWNVFVSSSLSATKRRMIVRSGQLFQDPLLAYQQLKSGATLSKQRYTSKADVEKQSLNKAATVGGSVRLISRPSCDKGISDASGRNKDDCKIKKTVTKQPGTPGGVVNGGTSKAKDEEKRGGAVSFNEEVMAADVRGLVQAMDASGAPLCLNCQSVYRSTLVTEATFANNAWQTRLCSKRCVQEFWTRRHRDYGARQVYEVEHGVCQICQFDASAFFQQIKCTSSVEKRARLIQDSKYALLPTEVKERMSRQPCQGQFWNVDHQLAVSDGGGECDVDNLRTLCTPCHRDVTRQQTKDRAKQRLVQGALNCVDIKTFFKPI